MWLRIPSEDRRKPVKVTVVNKMPEKQEEKSPRIVKELKAEAMRRSGLHGSDRWHHHAGLAGLAIALFKSPAVVEVNHASTTSIKSRLNESEVGIKVAGIPPSPVMVPHR